MIHLRSMTTADIPFGLRLSKAAGWNQTEADWEMLLANSQVGSLVARFNEVDAGTITTVSYQDQLHWIGMLLVAEGYQRRGIGRALLETALQSLPDAGSICLDATPAGVKLYESLGFKPVYTLTRWLRLPAHVRIPTKTTASPLTEGLIPETLLFDLPVFGARRVSLLSALLHRAPHLAFCCRSNSQLSGFCLGRKGSRFTQVGPIVADSLNEAEDLLLTALHMTHQEQVIIDSPVEPADWNQILLNLDFRELRPFTRMCLGDYSLPEQHWKQAAIAGPEIG